MRRPPWRWLRPETASVGSVCAAFVPPARWSVWLHAIRLRVNCSLPRDPRPTRSRQDSVMSGVDAANQDSLRRIIEAQGRLRKAQVGR